MNRLGSGWPLEALSLVATGALWMAAKVHPLFSLLLILIFVKGK